MRTRSRSRYRDDKAWNRVVDDYFNPDTGAHTYVPTLGYQDRHDLLQTSSITDLPLDAVPEVYLGRNRYGETTWLRNHRKRHTLPRGIPRQVKPCTHTKTSVFYEEEPCRYVRVQEPFPGWTITTVADLDRRRACEGLAYATVADMFNTYPRNYSVPQYRNHDWFSLMSQFDEALTSFVPSRLLIGEDMAESAIFFDALKTIFNPSNALKILFKSVKRLNWEDKSLEFVRRTVKGGTNSYLASIFGIKPAVQSLFDTMTAHIHVQSRLDYLKRNAGGYVPIRIRQVLQSGGPELNAADPSVASNQFDSPFINLVNKESIAGISAIARVRDDLNFTDTWTAYMQYFGLNKVLGLAWELVPFSFVVDWFTNAQERINYYTRLRTGGPFIDIRTPCYSIKQTLTEDLFITNRGKNMLGWHGVSTDNPFKVARREVKSYVRTTKCPDTSGVVDLSTLGTFHAVTGGALILQLSL